MLLKEDLVVCDFVLFGVHGDLAKRKLLPALYQLEKADLLHPDAKIIGVTRKDMKAPEFIDSVKDALDIFVKEDFCAMTWERLTDKLSHVSMDFTDEQAYQQIKEFKDPKRVMVCYLSTPPSIYQAICQGLNHCGVIDESVRVVLEKPIGKDLESSKQINNQVAEYFNESQIYRIDHYLGKETVLNLIALRFANAIFASNWDHNCIDHVQITVAESVGIEGRWGYFDEAGQMRDMVQNHLLQVLTLLAMEPPADLDADSIRDEKLKVLKCLRPIDSSNVETNTVRGQYSAGFLKGEQAPGYLEEEGANTKSSTETFVALKVEIDNWRWAGVPFYLRTGKRMPSKMTEIVVNFKQQPHNIFKNSFASLPSNKLVIRLQPDEGMELTVLNKVPGLHSQMDLQKTKLDLSFDETFKDVRIADAYERLLLEVIQGNQSLFVRRDEVEAAWVWCDGIIEAWKQSKEDPKPYQAGTWGPVASIALLARDDKSWNE